MSYFRLFLIFTSFLVLSAMSCEKSESSTNSRKASLAIPLDTFCLDLARTCPKLAALAAAYPPKLEPSDGSHLIHAELLNYLLDTVANPQNYFRELPGPCPGITRSQIHCAIGIPRDSLGVLEMGSEILLGDFYSYARDPEYGLAPTRFWTKAGYIPIFFYNSGDTLVVISQ